MFVLVYVSGPTLLAALLAYALIIPKRVYQYALATLYASTLGVIPSLLLASNGYRTEEAVIWLFIAPAFFTAACSITLVKVSVMLISAIHRRLKN